MANQLPSWLHPHPDDKAFTKIDTLELANRICSRCLNPINERTVPIMFWTESAKYIWQYHPVCLGIQKYDHVEIE